MLSLQSSILAAALRRTCLHAGVGWRDRGDRDVNIVGVRSTAAKPNAFDDLIAACWREGGRWYAHGGVATTEPGVYWLQHPMRPEGCAVLALGLHVDCWELGLHRGQYPAFVQRGPMRVLRDADLDAVVDPPPDSGTSEITGINLHRAREGGTSTAVDRWSAGCQVYASSIDLDIALDRGRIYVPIHGPRFDYRLLSEKQVVEALTAE